MVQSRLRQRRRQQAACEIVRHLLVSGFMHMLACLLRNRKLRAVELADACLPQTAAEQQPTTATCVLPQTGRKSQALEQVSNLRLANNLIARQRLSLAVDCKAKAIQAAARTVGKFVRQVVRRRLFEQCLLAARFNECLATNFRHRSGESAVGFASMPATARLLDVAGSMGSRPVRSSKTLAWKASKLSRHFGPEQRSVSAFRRLLDDLMAELLPFSLHAGQLQFDKSYFQLKKGKLSDRLVDLDCRCKRKAVLEAYAGRSRAAGRQVQEYRQAVERFIRANQQAVAERRVLYTLAQGLEHLARLQACRTRLGSGRQVESRPFAGMAFAFAE